MRQRLRRTRWPDAIDGAAWEYGIDVDVLRPIVDYWAQSFDFDAQQRRLNAFHHYRANGIHFIHEADDVRRFFLRADALQQERLQRDVGRHSA
ncbi:MAG: hypothetical protein QOI24_153 [Acidobacteriota bacterium]|nr:hypothetical protein [Acidobacteriota bacterium]